MESAVDMEHRQFHKQSPYLDAAQTQHNSDYKYARQVQSYKHITYIHRYTEPVTPPYPERRCLCLGGACLWFPLIY